MKYKSLQEHLKERARITVPRGVLVSFEGQEKSGRRGEEGTASSSRRLSLKPPPYFYSFVTSCTLIHLLTVSLRI